MLSPLCQLLYISSAPSHGIYQLAKALAARKHYLMVVTIIIPTNRITRVEGK
jgi:hypothetical protein